MNKKFDIIPKDCDYSIHDAVDELSSSLHVHSALGDIPQFVRDDLDEKIYQIVNLLYLHKVSCAIPCFKVLESLYFNYCDEGDLN